MCVKIVAIVETEGRAKGMKLRTYNWILLLFDARRVNLMLATNNNLCAQFWYNFIVRNIQVHWSLS